MCSAAAQAQQTALSASLGERVQERFLLPTHHTLTFHRTCNLKTCLPFCKEWAKLPRCKNDMREGVKGRNTIGRHTIGRHTEGHRQTDHTILISSRDQNITEFANNSGFTRCTEERWSLLAWLKIRTRPQGWATLLEFTPTFSFPI